MDTMACPRMTTSPSISSATRLSETPRGGSLTSTNRREACDARHAEASSTATVGTQRFREIGGPENPPSTDLDGPGRVPRIFGQTPQIQVDGLQNFQGIQVFSCEICFWSSIMAPERGHGSFHYSWSWKMAPIKTELFMTSYLVFPSLCGWQNFHLSKTRLMQHTYKKVSSWMDIDGVFQGHRSPPMHVGSCLHVSSIIFVKKLNMVSRCFVSNNRCAYAGIVPNPQDSDFAHKDGPVDLDHKPKNSLPEPR